MDQDAVKQAGCGGHGQTIGEDDLDILFSEPLQSQACGDRQSFGSVR